MFQCVYFQIFGDVVSTSDVGLTREVTFCDDNVVYFKNFLSGVDTGAYIMDVRDGNKIRIDFPQANKLMTDNTTGDEYKTYLFRLMHSTTDEVTDFDIYGIEDQYIELDINDDNSLITWEDATDFVGLCTFNGGWYGIGAWNNVFRKFEGTLVDFPPSDVARQTWALIWDGYPEVMLNPGYKDVKVAIDETNNEVYIGGLLTTDSDMLTWVKGTYADGVATIPSGQYLGVNEYDEYTFFMAARGCIEEDPVWHAPTLVSDPLEVLTLSIDLESKTLASVESDVMISLNRGSGKIYGDYYLNPVFQKQMAEGLAAAPKDPVITYASTWGEDGYMAYSLNNVNVKNMIQDTDDLFYNLLVNGEVFTLTKDEYPTLGYETLTDIPYAYMGGPISCWGTTYYFDWVNLPDIQSVGLQCFYQDPETGEKYYGNKVEYSFEESGIVDSILNEAEVISVEYYNLSGIKLQNPCTGICVKKEILTNGKIRVSKIVR